MSLQHIVPGVDGYMVRYPLRTSSLLVSGEADYPGYFLTTCTSDIY